MKALLIFMLATAFLGGCATTEKRESGGYLQRYSDSRKLSSAVQLIAKGETAAAAKLLTGIVASPPAAGVTDEALFRLALLTLKPTTERPASAQGLQLLRRLKKEFPASSWSVQAVPLLELVGAAEELKHQNRNLKSNNQALTKEVEKLNENIERLKRLDLEIERKSR
jgi:hypothetical protein